jgi:hypothetical protein
MSEIVFETFRLALETTRGTAIATPTHLLNHEGTLTPNTTRYRPRESRGTRARNYRAVDTRAMAEFEGEGDLDSVLASVLFNMAVAPVSTPSTPASAVLSRLWAHVGSVAADDIKTATVWWGDPNLTQQLRSTFAFLDELTIENDASSEEVATVSYKGMASKPTKVAAPAATAVPTGVTFPGQLMQLWIDSSSAIGTTAITDRLISVKHTIKTGAKAKFIAKGPAHDLSFSLLGRDKIVAVTTELLLERADYNEYDLWAAGTSLKVRVRHNGALIESVAGPTDFYHYVECDTYGPASDLKWEDHEGVNRALRITIEGAYDATLGSDIRVAVQNQRTTL